MSELWHPEAAVFLLAFLPDEEYSPLRLWNILQYKRFPQPIFPEIKK